MNRRAFLQSLTAAAIQRQPNIVFILVDQWRAQAFGYTGDSNATTPAIDALAAESVNFRNAVSGFPVCSPYRASLMTGQYAVKHGVVVNDVPLKPTGATLGQTFRTAGYDTGYIGKWHIYGSPDGKFGRRLAFIPREERFGFDYWKTCECTHDYNHSLYYHADDPTGQYWPGYDALAQTEDACNFIRQRSRAKTPYFLLLSLGPPHSPYGTAPEQYKAKYADRSIELRSNVPASHAVQANQDLRGYYAHIAALDDCVRQVKSALDQSGQADDTILVFASDHGDMLHSQGSTDKQQPWDESLRVPFLIRYPRVFGRRRRDLVTPLDAPDIMPTLLGLANLRVPESVQGTDYSSLITGKKREQAEPTALLNLPVSFSVVKRYGIAEYRGLRTPRYTYVRSIHGPWLLYDNDTDRLQMRNLVGNSRYRDLQARLDKTLDIRLKAAGDEFLPGDRYVERAKAGHYGAVNVQPGRIRSPWGDWEATWK